MLAAMAPRVSGHRWDRRGGGNPTAVTAMARDERPDVMFLERAGVGKQGPAETRADDLRVGARRRPCTRRFAVRALGQRTIWVGEAGAGTHAEADKQHLAGVRGRAVSGRSSPCRRLGGDGLDGGPLVSPWQSAKMQRDRRRRVLAQFALSLALKGSCTLRLEAASDDRSPHWPPWPTSGSRPLTRCWASRT